MSSRWATITIIFLLLILVGYIVIDLTLKEGRKSISNPLTTASAPDDRWIVAKAFEPGKGQLNAVTVSENGNIILGGESFIMCFDPDFNLLWEMNTEMPVTALTNSGNEIYAAVQEIILVLNGKGEQLEEWGPYENNSLITSLTSNKRFVAFGDAANKVVFILDKNGIVKSLIGISDVPFIIPSPYFDVALDDKDTLFVANPGNRRIEKRNTDGMLISSFGKQGIEPDAFAGCCNPSHFTLVPGGFITSEKGINRIKILNKNGEFIEFVSSANNFVPSMPLDIASTDGKTIYGANPADSKLHVFIKK